VINAGRGKPHLRFLHFTVVFKASELYKRSLL